MPVHESVSKIKRKQEGLNGIVTFLKQNFTFDLFIKSKA
jgi:hypothetical protein